MLALRAGNTGVNRHALVDSDDIDFSNNESITEDDAADTTFEVNVRNGGNVGGTSETYRNCDIKMERK